MDDDSLNDLARRMPITCDEDTSVGVALARMHEARVGSILIVDMAGHPTGIFTRHDVLDQVALAGRSLTTPMAAVMTRDPLTLEADATAYDAALLIARRGIRHVPVIERGVLTGVLTERDLFTAQRASLHGVNRSIAQAAAGARLAVVNWLARLTGRRRSLSHVQRERLAGLRAVPAFNTGAPIAQTRFVVVDVESTGLNVFSDRLIAIGATCVTAEALPLADSFYRVLKQSAPSSVNMNRHNAVADAHATAQLLLVTLARARSKGMNHINDLLQLEKDQRWLMR